MGNLSWEPLAACRPCVQTLRADLGENRGPALTCLGTYEPALPTVPKDDGRFTAWQPRAASAQCAAKSVAQRPTNSRRRNELRRTATTARPCSMTARSCTFVAVHTRARSAMIATHALSPLVMLPRGISKSVSLSKERFAIES